MRHATTHHAPPLVAFVAVALAIALALLVRYPFFLNSVAAFNSDEAVNALVVRRFLEHGEATLYNWDAAYYGVVEGMLSIPLVWVLGFEPLTFKLAAFAGLALLMIGTFALGRRLFGTAASLAAVVCLAVFSPQVVQWSIMASGGYLLVVAWGTAAFLTLDAVRRRPSLLRLALLGLVLGSGLYVYELFLVYLALFAAAGVCGSSAFALLRAAPRDRLAWRRLAENGRRSAACALAFAVGFAIGWSPKLAVLLGGSAGSKKPAYAFADAEGVLRQGELLLGSCLPAFFGVNPGDNPSVGAAIGEVGVAERWLGLALLAAYFSVWLAATWRRRHELAAVLALRPVRLGHETLLVLLVPLTALAFVLSANPQDVLSNRYLLPWLTSLPLLAGAAVARLGRRRAVAATLLLALLVGLPALQTARFYRSMGYLDSDLEPVRVPSELADLVAELERAGIRGGYATYWVSYKATMLSGEQVIMVPFDEWDRYPPYRDHVASLVRPAYVFHQHEPQLATFLWRIGGRETHLRRIGPYHVYTLTGGDRLFPPRRFPPVSLRRHLAEIEVLAAPGTAAPGEAIIVPIAVRNTSDEGWSATGVDGGGTFRVSVAYRWLDPQGHVVVMEGLRTLLPRDVGPGERVELPARVEVPDRLGDLVLMLTLVQDGVDWFDAASGSRALMPLTVLPDAAVAAEGN